MHSSTSCSAPHCMSTRSMLWSLVILPCRSVSSVLKLGQLHTDGPLQALLFPSHVRRSDTNIFDMFRKCANVQHFASRFDTWIPLECEGTPDECAETSSRLPSCQSVTSQAPTFTATSFGLGNGPPISLRQVCEGDTSKKYGIRQMTLRRQQVNGSLKQHHAQEESPNEKSQHIAATNRPGHRLTSTWPLAT